MLGSVATLCALIVLGTPPPQPASAPVPTPTALERLAATIEVSADPSARVWHGEPISLSLRDADLAEVLRSFARIGDFNLVLHPSISGKVTVELHRVPWDQALSVILKTHRLGLEVSGSVLSLEPAPMLPASGSGESH